MIESGFFPSKGGDRAYSAEQFGKIMDFLITDGVYEVYPETGVLYDESGQENKAYMPFKVQFISSKDAYYSPNNPSVIIGPGRAWFDHTWTHVSTPEIVAMPSDPATSTRWDILCLTMDKTDAMRRNYFEWVQGDRGVESPPLSKLKGHYMHGDQVHQVPIAFVKRRASSNGVPLQIRSAVGYALCPFVRAINGSRNNVWSVQHIIDAATAKIDERIASMSVVIDDWLAEKDQDIQEYLGGLKGEVTNEVLLEVNNRYDQLDRTLSTRIQGEVDNRLSGIEQELRDKVDIAVSDKMNELDIGQIVNNVISSEFADRFDTIDASIRETRIQAKLDAHPVGSYYYSNNSTDPATLFGGTWTKVQNTFLYARGSADSLNSTGGARTVTLTTANMPPHTHTLTNGQHSHSVSVASHTHGLNSHKHTMTHSHVVTGGDGGTLIGVGDCKGYAQSFTGGLTIGGGYWSKVGNVSPSVSSYTGSSGAATGSTATNSSASNTSGTVTVSCQSAGGSGGAATSFNIMPPYTAVNCWRRTA